MIRLNFEGYWTNISNLPSYGGIYIVYAVLIIDRKVDDARILYIGKSDNIHGRFVENGPHEHWEDFLHQLNEGERLAFSCAEVDGRSLAKVENALVYMQQPPVNGDLRVSYEHEAECLRITGVGESRFEATHFGFSVDNDETSFYIVDEVEDLFE